MRYCIFIDTDFCLDAAELILRLAEIDPAASFCGIYGGTANVLEAFLAQLPTDFPISRDIPSIDQLERQWVASGDPATLPGHEAYFGSRIVNECFMADKYVASGYISTGFPFEAPLTSACREHDAQLRYMAGLFNFARDYIERQRPDRMFFYAVANAFSVTFAHIARHEGIHFFTPIASRIQDGSTITEDFMGGLPHVRQTFEAIVAGAPGYEEFLAKAAQHIEEFVARPEMPAYQQFMDTTVYSRFSLPTLLVLLAQSVLPFYTHKSMQMIYPSVRLLTHFRDGHLRRTLKRRKIWRRQKDLEGCSYALLALHHDPEASTMVWTPMFTDQLAVIEAFSKAIPLGWTLAVKEHRSTWGKRPLSFYERLSRIPKVMIIHPMEDQFTLIKRARIIAGIHGTTAFEGMLLGRVPVLLGHPSYFDIGEGFVRCTDFQGLPEAVEQALATNPARRERLVQYIAAVLANSFPCHPKLYAETWCTPEENLAKKPSILRLASVLSGTHSYATASAFGIETN